MKIVFFGNADFGCNALESLVKSRVHDVISVITNKDKKSGRNLKLLPSPIKTLSQKLGLNILEVNNLKKPELIDFLKKISPDIFVVIAYKIIPKQIYSIPNYGSINVHASLLPAYKGAAPIQRAIINDERYTGLSSFFLNNLIDGGKLINQLKITINENDTFKEVWHNLYNNSSDFLLESLDMIEKNETNIITHLDLKESYAPKINKKELEIKWEEPNILIHNKVRAFNPLPSMFTHLNQKRIKIVKSSISNYSNDNIKVGTIVADADKLLVKCGTGFLEIVELRPDSKKNMKSIDFINGFSKFLIPPYNVFK